MKKVIIAMTVLATFGLATVLDGVSGLGLGSNPAAPAIWKNQKRIDAGFNLLGKTADASGWKANGNEKFAYTDSGLENLWATYTDSIQDYWYTVGFSTGVGAYDDPSTTTKIYTNNTKSRLGRTDTKAYNATGYALNLSVAKNLNLPAVGNIIGGVKVDFNAPAGTYISTQKWASTYGGNKNVVESSSSYDPYLTFGLGAVKAIDAKQTLVIGQTLGTERKMTNGDTIYKTNGKQTNKDKGGDGNNDFIPAETALGYVYKVSDALEVAGAYVYNWGGKYDYQRFDNKGKDIGDALELNPQAYRGFGLAVDYIYSEFQAQGYINWAKGSGVVKTEDGDYVDTNSWSLLDDDNKLIKGNDNTTLGINLLWTPSFANIGTVGVGIENSKDVYGVDTTDSTTTALFYTYLF
ncbi:hypothetical protein NO1_0454 [Candidatus Termititenax aidoneus]|uniref:Uncharacterized protein n=1 Tax=Termititenax aidoneus TaxID=2218524 RepID=A0A388T9T9_TERA1|nr:hypothetical protein NO1_0454 [Candidatus Termititenax aidoneus]